MIMLFARIKFGHTALWVHLYILRTHKVAGGGGEDSPKNALWLWRTGMECTYAILGFYILNVVTQFYVSTS